MRNRLSKVLAVVLSFLMIATTFSYAAGSDQFSDVQSGSWYVPYVDFVVDNGYMNGTSATTFEPNGNLTRAMFATILARYDGATVDNSKETAFSDVPVNQWYTGSIAWANEKSIVNGTGNGKFSPNNNITRQDLCVMVERYITYVETTTTKRHVVRDVAITFTDEADIDSYAKSAVDKAVIHGLVNGYPDGSFKPKQFITRAECAAIISRIAWVEGDGKDSHTITVYDEKGKATKVEVPTGETYTIPEGPTKANATFKSWNTQKDGKGTTYNPGEKILLTEDMSLYPIYEEEPIDDPGGGGGGVGPVEKKTYYQVTAQLKVPESLKSGTIDLQTKEYTENEAAGKTLDDVITDLVTGDNQDLITNAFGEALGKVKGQTYKNDQYTVTVDADGVITAIKNSDESPVNLKNQLDVEKETYENAMAELHDAAGIPDSCTTQWDALVNDSWIENLLDFSNPTNPELLTDTKYYDALKKVVDDSIALHQALKSNGYDFAEGVAAAADWAQNEKGISFNGYTINEGTVTDPLDILNGTRLIGALNYDTNIIIDVLNGANTHVVLDAKEHLGDTADDIMKLIKDRTSLDFSDHEGGVEAILESVVSNGKLLGDYEVIVTVKKIEK